MESPVSQLSSRSGGLSIKALALFLLLTFPACSGNGNGESSTSFSSPDSSLVTDQDGTMDSNADSLELDSDRIRLENPTVEMPAM